MDDHLLFIQYSGVTNKQVTDELKQDNDEIKKKLNIYDLVISKSNKIPKQILVQNQNFSPENMYSPKANNSTTIITESRRLHHWKVIFYKNGDTWNIEHEIISPKFYELLIKIELKGDTDMDLKNF